MDSASRISTHIFRVEGWQRERTPLMSRVVRLRDELSYEMKVLRPWTFLLHTLGRGFSRLGSWLKDKADFA